MESEVSFELEEAKWFPVIGQFIVDFASIEDSLHAVVKHHVRNTFIKAEWFAERFEEQLQVFENVMTHQVLKRDADKKNLQLFLKKVKPLRKTRNLIAHNSLGLSFQETAKGDMKEIGFTIEGKRNKNNSLNFKKIASEAKQLTICRTLLCTLMMKFHENELKLIRAMSKGIGALPITKKIR